MFTTFGIVSMYEPIQIMIYGAWSATELPVGVPPLACERMAAASPRPSLQGETSRNLAVACRRMMLSVP